MKKQFTFYTFVLAFLFNVTFSFGQAADDIIIYDDALQNNFGDNGWRTDYSNVQKSFYDFNSTEQVHGGSKSIKATIGWEWNDVSFWNKTTIYNTSDYPGGIVCWVYGKTALPGQSTVKLTFKSLGASNDYMGYISPVVASNEKYIDIAVGTWTKIELKWNQIGNPTQFDHLSIRSNTATPGQEFYIDDVYLVKNVPVVNYPIKPSAFIYNDALPSGHQTGSYGANSEFSEHTAGANPNRPVKIGNKARYIKGGDSWTGMVFLRYGDGMPLLSDLPNGIGFWVYGVTGSVSNPNVSSLDVRNMNISNEANGYNWGDFSEKVRVDVPINKWTYVTIAWDQFGYTDFNKPGTTTPATTAGIRVEPVADEFNAGSSKSSFMIDDIRYLGAPACPGTGTRVNGLSGTVTKNGVALNDAGMYVTVSRNNEIEDVVPVVNGAFTLDAKFCNDTYMVSLGTTMGGSQSAAAPSGLIFKEVKVGSQTVNASGKIALNFSNSGIANARRSADVTDLNFNLQSSSPQPVVLKNFDAQMINNGVKLKWSTASESNFSHFEVLKSNNGKEFNPISKIVTNQNKNYTTIDKNPTNGLNYYKLKLVDLDGTTEYSKIVSIDFKSNGSFVEINNPVENELIMVKTNLENPTFTLYSGMGRKESVKLKQTANGMYEISTSNNLNGVYYLNVNSKSNSFTKKLFFK